MAVARTTAGRLALVEGLLRRAGPLEVKYLLKLMLGDMRIGVKQSLVEEAIAVAASEAPSQSGVAVSVAAVRNAVMLEADLAGAVRRAFAGTLGEARMRLFHPLGFMLASPVETPEEAVERFTGKPWLSRSKEQRQEQRQETKYGGLSTPRRTIRLSVSPVEMTVLQMVKCSMQNATTKSNRRSFDSRFAHRSGRQFKC